MKPASEFHALHEHSKKVVVINGQRPSPLLISRDSHLIRKPPPNSSFITSIVAEKNPHKQQQKKDPIIIYTKSPKIIHTKAQNFMALVQRLTGLSRTNEASENFGSSFSDGSNSNISIKQQGKQGFWDVDKTSSALGNGETRIKEEPHIEHSISTPDSLRFAADMPLFTPNSLDFFCSSKSVYKYSEFPYGILGSLLSPGVESFKELPEY